MPSAQEAVWTDIDLGYHIFQFLHVKQVVPLITVNKHFFVYAVGKIYEEIAHVRYDKVRQSCNDSERDRIYREAVRRLDLTDHSDRLLPATEWVHLFDQFPNSTSIFLGRERLTKSSGIGELRYHYDRLRYLYPFEAQLIDHCANEESLETESLKAWSVRTLVYLDLSLLHPIFEERNGDLGVILEDHLDKDDVTMYSFSVDLHWVSQELLKYLRRQDLTRRRIRLENLYSYHLDQSLLEIVVSQAGSLRTMHLYRFEDAVQQPCGLIDLMDKIPWSELCSLKDLYIECDRNNLSRSERSLIEIPIPRSHSLPGYGIRRLKVKIVYPSEANLTEEQIIEEKKVIKNLARLIAPLVDTGKWNWTERWSRRYLRVYHEDEDGRHKNAELSGILGRVFVGEIESCMSRWR